MCIQYTFIQKYRELTKNTKNLQKITIFMSSLKNFIKKEKKYEKDNCYKFRRWTRSGQIIYGDEGGIKLEREGGEL